jgi:hypothetical protein
MAWRRPALLEPILAAFEELFLGRQENFPDMLNRCQSGLHHANSGPRGPVSLPMENHYHLTKCIPMG